jgi:methyl coenzyme M reductase subunit C
LERKVALCTMHELLVTLADSPIKKHIVIEPKPTIKKIDIDHIIKIKCPVDEKTIKNIEPVAQKYNLKIEKIEDALILH